MKTTGSNLKKAVLNYMRAGYAPIPVPSGTKAPRIRGWQTLRIDENEVDKLFAEPTNVGLLLGKPSGGLIDVDLDAPEALRSAPKFLPSTEMVHGRSGKPSSHYWYVTQSGVPPKKFLDVDGTSLLEIRSIGQQTVVAPSIHPSGDRIRWENAGQPTRVKGAELLRCVARGAASTLLARHWPEAGARNDAALACAGMLLRAGYSTSETSNFLKATAYAARDEQWRERGAAASSTQTRLSAEGTTTGTPRLRELVGDAVVDLLHEWLEIREDEPTGSDGENLTDLGNCRRLVKDHGEKIRYCHESKRWYRFNRKCWKIDTNGAIERLAKKTVRKLSEQAARCKNAELRSRLATWARASESLSRITAMINLARSELQIPVAPSELDSDPWLLNFANGTVNLRTGQLRNHDLADLCTKMVSYEFDPNAKCPLFTKFLRRIFDDDVELIGYLQRMFGYSLTGSTREQVILVCWGIGANGKSTLLETFRAGLGDYACTADSSLLMTKAHDGIRNDVARLVGIRFVSTGETEAGRYLAEALVKQLTGNDKVAARFLYSEFFEFDPQFKLALATNHKPAIRGTDDAIWRRIHLVPFNVTIPEVERDKLLSQKLRKELPGILAWAVRGCLQWQKDGLNPPDKVLFATRSYRAESDVLGAFFKDCCVVRSDLQETAGNLYATYKSWCETNGEKSMTQQRFGGALADRGFTSTRTRRIRSWIGLQRSDIGVKGNAVLP
jgi:putative DNA primase/helicase